jgi:hypothetical protein
MDNLIVEDGVVDVNSRNSTGTSVGVVVDSISIYEEANGIERGDGGSPRDFDSESLGRLDVNDNLNSNVVTINDVDSSSSSRIITQADSKMGNIIVTKDDEVPAIKTYHMYNEGFVDGIPANKTYHEAMNVVEKGITTPPDEKIDAKVELLTSTSHNTEQLLPLLLLFFKR